MPSAKNSLQKVLDLAGQFVTAQNGMWDHNEWEALVERVAAVNGPMDDEGKRNLGNILEASKYFFAHASAPAPKKAAARKAAPKKK